MSVINTNVSATIAQNALVKTNRQMQTAMQQLSTGSRINSAKDDAAGLAITSKMTSQINGLNQAVRNANDAISLVQTAEGALIEVTNMLQRMRELAVQSANDTNSSSDRDALNLEYNELRSEINRIAENTQFNGFDLLRGTAGAAGNVVFQVGANEAQTISIEVKNFRVGATITPTVMQLNTVTTVSGGSTSGTSGQTLGREDVTSAEISLGDPADTFSISFASGQTEIQLATALQDAIRSKSGFEDVTVQARSTTIEITDSGGRTVGITLKANNADGASVDVISATAIQVGVIPPASGAGELRMLNGTSITNQGNSDNAIVQVDAALVFVNNERAVMGATINRLNYAADNLMNVSQNASESRSRILDTDFAQVTTELARTQIIAQAGTAMLAQANQQPQSVLALLQ